MATKEPYRFQDGESNEILVNLLITPDGRGTREKRKALKEILARYKSDSKDCIEIKQIVRNS